MFVLRVSFDGSRLGSSLSRRAFAGIEGERIRVGDILAVLARDACGWLWLPCAGARTATGRRRRRRSLIFQIIEVLVRVSVLGVGRFYPGEGDFLKAAAREVNLDAGLGSGFDAERTLVRLSQRRINTPSANHDVGRILKVLWNVHVGYPMGRSLLRL